MLTWILAIVAAIVAGGAVYGATDSWGAAIGLVILAWVLGAVAVLFVGGYFGFAGNYATWGMLIGCGVLFFIYSGK